MATIAELEGIIMSGTANILMIAIVLFVTLVAARIINAILKRSIKKASAHIKVDPAKYNFVRHLVGALIYIMGVSIAVLMIPQLRTLAISLFAGAGVIAVIIGFASQQAFSNIVSGIFITIFKPFRVGERIKIGTNAGVVEDITLRHTVIRNFENKRIIIPNSVISNETIENWDAKDRKICRWIDIGISYDSDIDKAMKIIQDETKKHPEFLDNRTEEEKKKKSPAVTVRLVSFGDSSVNLRAYVWAKDPASAFGMGCDLNKSIKERFDREGIEIPFPYRTLVYKKGTKKPSSNAAQQKKSKARKKKYNIQNQARNVMKK